MLDYILLFFLIFFFICSLIFRISKFPRCLFLDGFNMFMIFFGFYFILRPIDYLIVGRYMRVNPLFISTGIDVEHYLIKSLACSILALICFFFGYFSSFSKPLSKTVAKAVNTLGYGIRRNSTIFSIGFISVSLCFALLLGYRFFTNNLLLLAGLGFLAVKKEKYRLLSFIIFLVIFVFSFYHYLFIHAERRDLFKLVYVVIMLNATFARTSGISSPKRQRYSPSKSMTAG